MGALFGKIVQQIRKFSRNFLGTLYRGIWLEWILRELRAIVSEGFASEDLSILEQFQKILKAWNNLSKSWFFITFFYYFVCLRIQSLVTLSVHYYMQRTNNNVFCFIIYYDFNYILMVEDLFHYYGRKLNCITFKHIFVKLWFY